ncbi:Uncharacterized membrane protein [Loktanella sp. DSM 29012]|uniref:DUF2189 domain-containing protein n=1 Tax=Loktanella sp. DSM 29012 TaxID=1881056 RepID=UPI0008CFECDE|nr:DUF2189 domain-containing protein [Loktanella sp. DSM 29012]SEQ47045.1 Uncharacterized membrane protein [Loktanella sp. DSM 29012]
MTQNATTPPTIRPVVWSDFTASLALGVRDFRAALWIDLCLACVFVLAGLGMAAVTVMTGQTFWLVLAVLGFPMVGTLAAVGFYEVSRQRSRDLRPGLRQVASLIWAARIGQIPWLAAIVVVIFLFWFFIGHMIFALFLGLAPMTNISTSLAVFLTPSGLTMIAVGTLVGAMFSGLVLALSVHAMPMLLDLDVDFITAMLRSLSAVLQQPMAYLVWGAFIGVVTLLSALPVFLGLFVTMPILGHASWHLYQRLVSDP